GIGNARPLHAEQLAERPSRVVVGTLLGVVRAPVLVVEEHVCNAAVGLVHAHAVAAGRDMPRLGLGRGGFRLARALALLGLVLVVAVLLLLLRGHLRVEGGARPRDLASLEL